jgi:hypothetical protein
MVIRSWFGPQEKDVPFRKLDFKEYLMTGQVKNPLKALGIILSSKILWDGSRVEVSLSF